MIIGLTGKKQVGKDTLAKHLIEKYGYVKYAFADSLKQACKEIFLLNDEQMDGDLKEVVDKRWKLSPRTLFQRVGTEMFREQLLNIFSEIKCGNNIWVYRFKLWYQQELKKNKDLKVVITDCRFPDEIDIVKQLNGVVIKINRNNSIIDKHVSETNIDNIVGDYVLENNSTIDNYYKQLDLIMNKI